MTSSGIQSTFLQRKSLYLSTKLSTMKINTSNNIYCIYLIKSNFGWLHTLKERSHERVSKLTSANVRLTMQQWEECFALSERHPAQ